MNFELSENAENLLKGNMCLCLDDLINHIKRMAPSKMEFFREFLEFLATLKLPHSSYELGDSSYLENEEYLNLEIMNYSEKYEVVQYSTEYCIVDSIRHAFISFCFGGLESLYKNREAESWYPKVIIRKKLGSVALDGELVVYRGTSKEEYESGVFGQSWTLREDVANDFAFKHYSAHDDYVNTERLVIKSRIHASHIYFYDESDSEGEVVVDERALIEVPPEIICQKILV